MTKILLNLIFTIILLTAAPPAVQAAPAPQISHVEQAPDFTVRAMSGGIEIDIPADAPMPVAVFAITGRQIVNAEFAPGRHIIDLPAGYYIVRCGNSSIRVVVK